MVIWLKMKTKTMETNWKEYTFITLVKERNSLSLKGIWCNQMKVWLHFPFQNNQQVFFARYLKGLSVIVHSKLHSFPNPQISFAYSERTPL